MRPNINVLENGVSVTREMTEEEYNEYLELLSKEQHGSSHLAADYAYVKNNFANAIKGTATGNPVCITDCSPVEHEMAVKVDLPGATVTRYGKNLIDMRDWVEKGAATIAEDGSYYINLLNMFNTYGRPETGKYMYKPENGNLPLVWTITAKKDGPDMVGACFGIIFEYTDGTSESKSYYGHFVDGVSQWGTITVQSNPDKVIKLVRYSWGAYNTWVKDFQLEVGTTATPYEPYVAPTAYTADENGNVKGVMSVCPTTTLIAEDGATVSVQYNRDANKAICAIEATLKELLEG